MINSLQSLRGIFAICIFLHHVMYNGNNLFLAGGPMGVCFFFILSGFVMCAGWEKKIDKNKISFGQLYLRRIFRLYPLHILCLAVAILLNYSNYSTEYFGLQYFANLMPNLLLIQSWFPIESIFFSGNALSWCLSDFMFFYGIFPFAMIFIEKHRKTFYQILVLIILIYLYFIQFIPEEFDRGLVYINPAFRLTDFFLGIALWQIYVKYKDSSFIQSITQNKITLNIIEISTLLILSITVLIYRNVAWEYAIVSLWWIPAIYIIIVFAFCNKAGGVSTNC